VLQAHRERDQVLLEAVVELALQCPTLLVRGENEPPPQRVDMPNVQGDRPPA
jgi:hypothetical protein